MILMITRMNHPPLSVGSSSCDYKADDDCCIDIVPDSVPASAGVLSVNTSSCLKSHLTSYGSIENDKIDDCKVRYECLLKSTIESKNPDPTTARCAYHSDLNDLQVAITDLTTRVDEIMRRNEEKDIDKAFESSMLRVVVIMVLTYCCVYAYLLFLGTSHAELNALVPTVGFNLSTWSLRCKCVLELIIIFM